MCSDFQNQNQNCDRADLDYALTSVFSFKMSFFINISITFVHGFNVSYFEINFCFNFDLKLVLNLSIKNDSIKYKLDDFSLTKINLIVTYKRNFAFWF